jgi:hypothetical protein
MASVSFGSNYGARSKTIEVPLQHEQVLEVVCNDLPSNPTELTDIFRQEAVNLPYYRMLAVRSRFRSRFFSVKRLIFSYTRLNTMSKTRLNKALRSFKRV